MTVPVLKPNCRPARIWAAISATLSDLIGLRRPLVRVKKAGNSSAWYVTTETPWSKFQRFLKLVDLAAGTFVTMRACTLPMVLVEIEIEETWWKVVSRQLVSILVENTH